LVDALVDDVAGEAGGLPLLATALLDLWRDRDGSTLTHATYERTGGVRGAVGRHAEAAFRSLGEDDQQVARRILLRLVAGGEGEGLNRLEREFLEESRTAFARANRRLRALLALAVLLLVAAVGAGAIALAARGSAKRQATAAIAQRLGAQALVEPRLDRALLLAREGVNLDDSVATRSNLLAALLRSPAAVAVLHGGGTRVLDDALSRDGHRLVVRSDDGSVTFFDARTLRVAGRRFKGSAQLSYLGSLVRPVRALAFSPDGRTLAVGDTDGSHAKP